MGSSSSAPRKEDLRVSQNWGYHFGGPHYKDYSIWGSILGSLILGNYHFGGAGAEERIGDREFIGITWFKIPLFRAVRFLRILGIGA